MKKRHMQCASPQDIHPYYLRCRTSCPRIFNQSCSNCTARDQLSCARIFTQYWTLTANALIIITSSSPPRIIVELCIIQIEELPSGELSSRKLPKWTKTLLLGLAFCLYLPMSISRQVDSPCYCGHFEMRMTYVGLSVPEL